MVVILLIVGQRTDDTARMTAAEIVTARTLSRRVICNRFQPYSFAQRLSLGL
jgi:hypothetical protein